jgi:hypothetical protein
MVLVPMVLLAASQSGVWFAGATGSPLEKYL